MSKTPAPTPEETVAAKRYAVMNLIRLIAIAAVIVGIAIAREVIAVPYPLGVALAVTGLIAFFFLPAIMAKRWKAGDRGER